MSKGSIARAGKVKNQTPKVEKQEKPRQKTGRARRRELFEKRKANNLFETRKMKMNPQAH
ncbi:40S ribosomal S30 [Tubulinosema ratisbonensis]|uniref:40S ribosomal protein S30 n=1 Tax=Tubulinosema ratisbonensis TaxID=291195 RepID=A0A437AJF3_9MICR|nr:40S ribosomal S30 [Tubulinosema ratisbonensis]